MENLINYLFGFSLNKDVDASLFILKEDICNMKDSDDSLSSRVQKDLQHTPDILDRHTLMKIQKKFSDRFIKLGSLSQKCPYCFSSFKSNALGEKECSECKEIFFVKKRVQDMNTVSLKKEEEKFFELQWKCAAEYKTFKDYLNKEYEYMNKKLIKQGKKNIKQNDIMYELLNAYAKNSVSVGHYKLYATFIFYKAELLRSEFRFAEALSHYLYVYFLQINAVTNTAEFSTSYIMNEELKENIKNLLDLGNLQMKDMKKMFDYSIKFLNIFSENSLEVSLNRSYLALVKEFKSIDALKRGIKPMKSFVLYHEAS